MCVRSLGGGWRGVFWERELLWSVVVDKGFLEKVVF